jgi:periplasmic copper chaperone A
VRPRIFAFLLATILLPTTGLHAAQADHVTAGHAWIRLLPGNLPAGGYVILQNNGATAAMLVAAQSATYASVMIHQSVQETDGTSRMAMIGRLMIPAHGNISLAPASYHLMLQQASHSLKVGDNVDITLDFADGSRLPVRFLVRPANAVDTN